MRSRKCLAAIALISLIAGCTESAVAPTPAPRGLVTDPISAAQAIARLGFRAEGLDSTSDYYVIDGDILLRKDRVRPQLEGQSRPNYQWYTGVYFYWAGTSGGNVLLDLSGLQGQGGQQYIDAANAARDAAASWNNIAGFGLNFAENNGATPRLRVLPMSTGCTTGGQADWPDYGGPGVVYVNINPSCSYSYSTRILIAAHEIGHAIGLRHSDWQLQTGEFNCPLGFGPCAVKVPGTPDVDLASIMLAAPGPWAGFSTNDRAAARWLFPGSAAAVTASVVDSTQLASNVILKWDPVPDAVSYKVYAWYTWMNSSFQYVPVYVPLTTTTALTFTDLSNTTFGIIPCPAVLGMFDSGYDVFTVFSNKEIGPKTRICLSLSSIGPS